MKKLLTTLCVATALFTVTECYASNNHLWIMTFTNLTNHTFYFMAYDNTGAMGQMTPSQSFSLAPMQSQKTYISYVTPDLKDKGYLGIKVTNDYGAKKAELSLLVSSAPAPAPWNTKYVSQGSAWLSTYDHPEYSHPTYKVVMTTYTVTIEPADS